MQAQGCGHRGHRNGRTGEIFASRERGIRVDFTPVVWRALSFHPSLAGPAASAQTPHQNNNNLPSTGMNRYFPALIAGLLLGPQAPVRAATITPLPSEFSNSLVETWEAFPLGFPAGGSVNFLSGFGTATASELVIYSPGRPIQPQWLRSRSFPGEGSRRLSRVGRQQQCRRAHVCIWQLDLVVRRLLGGSLQHQSGNGRISRRVKRRARADSIHLCATKQRRNPRMAWLVNRHTGD